MKLIDYIKGLVPNFGKARITEDARVTRNELTGVAIPCYKNAQEVFKTTLVSPRAQGFAKQYRLMVGAHKNTFVADIYERLEKLVKVLDVVEREVTSNFGDKVVSESLTLHKANVLRALEAIAFVTKFSVSLLNAVYVDETAAYGKTQPYSSDMTEGEYKRIERYFMDFCSMLKALTTPNDAAKVFAAIPDAQAEGIDNLREVFGEDRVDPFNLFSPTSQFRGNPIYFVRTVMLDRQMERYKHTQEQKRLLELRLLHLQRRKQNNPDAEVEKQIETVSSRVASLAAELRKFEESFA